MTDVAVPLVEELGCFLVWFFAVNANGLESLLDSMLVIEVAVGLVRGVIVFVAAIALVHGGFFVALVRTKHAFLGINNFGFIFALDSRALLKFLYFLLWHMLATVDFAVVSIATSASVAFSAVEVTRWSAIFTVVRAVEVDGGDVGFVAYLTLAILDVTHVAHFACAILLVHLDLLAVLALDFVMRTAEPLVLLQIKGSANLLASFVLAVPIGHYRTCLLLCFGVFDRLSSLALRGTTLHFLGEKGATDFYLFGP